MNTTDPFLPVTQTGLPVAVPSPGETVEVEEPIFSAGVDVKDYFLCLFSKRIVCKSEPEVHFYRKLRYARED